MDDTSPEKRKKQIEIIKPMSLKEKFMYGTDLTDFV